MSNEHQIFCDAVEVRAKQLTFDHKEGDYIYTGCRTAPAELGWRLRQSYGLKDIQDVLKGKHDDLIHATYHDAANAQYWYQNEKQWD